MMSSMFIAGGLDALLNPQPKVPVAEHVASRVAAPFPSLAEQDTETLIRINGGVQVGAGTLLALDRFPRLSALALAASLVPTTAAGHRFWEYDDKAERQQQQIHFFKNLSMLGGLLLAAVDTEGKPGLAWRAHHAAEHAEKAVRSTRRQARLAAKAARAGSRVPLGL
jgi:putative oxidoreductase